MQFWLQEPVCPCGSHEVQHGYRVQDQTGRWTTLAERQANSNIVVAPGQQPLWLVDSTHYICCACQQTVDSRLARSYLEVLPGAWEPQPICVVPVEWIMLMVEQSLLVPYEVRGQVHFEVISHRGLNPTDRVHLTYMSRFRILVPQSQIIIPGPSHHQYNLRFVSPSGEAQNCRMGRARFERLIDDGTIGVWEGAFVARFPIPIETNPMVPMIPQGSSIDVLPAPQQDPTELSSARKAALETLMKVKLTASQDERILQMIRDQLIIFSLEERGPAINRWDVIGEDL